MIRNLIFENIISGMQRFNVHPHVSVCFFLIFRFSRRKSQSQLTLAKKITDFTIQFRSKILTHFTKLNSLDTENNMLPQNLFWLYEFSSKHISWQSSGIIIFLCKYFLVISDALVGFFLNVLFWFVTVILSELYEKQRKNKYWVTEKST